MNYWKKNEEIDDKEFYDKKVDEFASKADLTSDEKDVLRFVIDGVAENTNEVSTKQIAKWIDGKVSVLLSTKKKLRKFS